MPVNTLPTRSDCMDFLRTSRNAIIEMNGADAYWFVDGVKYPEDRALMLAEFCILTGQRLTSIATIEAALNQVRRITETEMRLASLDRDLRALLEARASRRWWQRHG